MKKDSINFTEDLVNSFCEETGTDKVMMKRMYEFYTKTLSKKIGTKQEVVEAPIKGLGIFFMPLHGVSIILNRKKAFSEKYEGEWNKKAFEFYTGRKEYIRQKITKCRECGIKNIKFLYTLIKKDYIKNA